MLSADDVAGNLGNLLNSSVDHHLTSDVEVATTIPGGMVGSCISAISAKFESKGAFVGRYQESGYD